MNQTRPAVMTGGCQCGAVRYALYRSPVNPHICHCRMCQKAMGGPITAYAAVLASDFSWTRGAAKTFESSSIVTRGFCGDCGTPLSFRFVDDKWIGFTLATLDEPDGLSIDGQGAQRAVVDDLAGHSRARCGFAAVLRFEADEARR